MKVFDINVSVVNDNYCCKTNNYDIMTDIPHKDKFTALLKCGKTVEFKVINNNWYSECDNHLLQLSVYVLNYNNKRILIFKYQVYENGNIIRKISGNNILDVQALITLKKMGIKIIKK